MEKTVMKKNGLIWIIAVILIIVAVYTTDNYNPKSSEKENTTNNSTQTPLDTASEKALDFTLKDLEGNTVSLSDYKGENVYVNFFATWCPPCKGEMPDIEKISQKYKDKDLVVLAVDLGEDRDTVKNFIAENNLSFKVLLDSDQTATELYQITSIPVSVFIDKKGNVVAKKVGAMTGGEMELYVKMLVNKK